MSVKVIGKHEKDSRACRDALALTLNEMMAEDKSIVYVDCDLMGCINTKMLRKNYPDRAFEAGIAEANGAGVAAGLAAAGKKVFFHSFGTFSSRRCYDQIYMSAAYAGLPVHVLGSDAGVTAAFNGGTHMPLEDAAMYLSIPETVVLDPADYAQLECITRQLPGITSGVTYTRFVRKGIVKVYEDGSEFPIGKGVVLHESDKDVATIITSGIMVDESLKAYEALQAEGISVRVIDMFTWKPEDRPDRTDPARPQTPGRGAGHQGRQGDRRYCHRREPQRHLRSGQRGFQLPGQELPHRSGVCGRAGSVRSGRSSGLPDG